MSPWSFAGITRLSPDPSALAPFYGRLPWPLPIDVEQGEAAGVRLEVRCPEERDARTLRDPEGFELRVTPGRPPARGSDPAWFEGVSIFTPLAEAMRDFYVSLPGARVEIDGDGHPLVAIVRLGLSRVALMRTPTVRWHLEFGLPDESLLAGLTAAGFTVGALRHRPWGETSTSIKDPDGVELEFEVEEPPVDQTPGTGGKVS